MELSVVPRTVFIMKVTSRFSHGLQQVPTRHRPPVIVFWQEGGLVRAGPVTPCLAAGDTSGKSRRLTARPAAQRLSGQFFERAAALTYPKDPDHEAGQQRARNGD